MGAAIAVDDFSEGLRIGEVVLSVGSPAGRVSAGLRCGMPIPRSSACCSGRRRGMLYLTGSALVSPSE